MPFVVNNSSKAANDKSHGDFKTFQVVKINPKDPSKIQHCSDFRLSAQDSKALSSIEASNDPDCSFVKSIKSRALNSEFGKRANEALTYTFIASSLLTIHTMINVGEAIYDSIDYVKDKLTPKP